MTTFSYRNQEFLTARDAAYACLEAFIETQVSELDPTIELYLQSRIAEEVLGEMTDAGWPLPEGVSEEDARAAIDMMRHVFEDDEATVVTQQTFAPDE